VLITGAASIVIENTFVLLTPRLLVTFMVVLVVPAAVGVPLITPPVLRLNPPGRLLPVSTDQVYGVSPPLADRVWVYPIPISPSGSGDAVSIRGAVYTVRSNCLVVVPPRLSVNLMVKVDFPVPVGVPLITPPAKPSPAGNVPLASDQV